MAVYKVPQDVEADDKLIGPFSFRQFIYLLIVAMAGALSWGLAQLFIPLAIIPMPIILFFGALALPLRKDQPMEIYMAAMLSFFLKPHQRKWDPDGIESLIEITAPKTIEIQRTKDISQSEAQRRLGYLAEVVDSRGWAVRTDSQAINSSMTSDAYYDAQTAEDILGDKTQISETLDQKLSQSDAERKQKINDLIASKTATFDYFVNDKPQTETPDESILINHQYLESIPAKDIDKPTQPAINTSEKQPSAGIINLANSTDLSIATIASQANRISKNEEVFISLR